ncbi:S8 family serine peptidase [Prosthecobacter sp.]|uniref:RCC1 domain-containing protein n=1 Tax=Prosthecobacter sp. TaxID=1965333 RepID=UPI003783B1B0
MKHIVSVLLLMMAGLSVEAQNVSPEDFRDDAVRRLFTETLRDTQSRQMQAMHAKARKAGWREDHIKGPKRLLIGEMGGVPLVIAPFNANAAISSGVTLVQRDLPAMQGGGLQVGVWDGGAVLSTHREFNDGFISRVTVVNNVAADNHATHVAGTIVARGVDSKARGMAPQARILSYDYDYDTSEMSSLAAASMPLNGKLLLSNHSYGFVNGWGLDEKTNRWYFYGRLADREDFKFGLYSDRARDWDIICAQAPYYLPCKAAGNDRSDGPPAENEPFYYFNSNNQLKSKNYSAAVDPPEDGATSSGWDTMDTTACAKNVLTVGAVTRAVSGGVRDYNSVMMTSFSGWGPTDDGRIKPDVVADGVDVYSSFVTPDGRASYDYLSGTSMATPATTGALVLLQQLYESTHPGQYLRAATLKGLVISTARDMGAAGPDYKYGWGYVDTRAAAQVIQNHSAYPNGQSLLERQLSQGAVDTYTVPVRGGRTVRATLCWTDPAGPSRGAIGSTNVPLDNAASVLVNDLDMRISMSLINNTPYVLNPASPNNTATRGDNFRDNVEVVEFTPSASGTCQLTVQHKGTLTGGKQAYSLIITGHDYASAPLLGLSTEGIAVESVAQGSAPAPVSFLVANVGTGTLNYTLAADQPWLSVSPGSNSSAGESNSHTITFNTSQLAPGTYTATITVSPAGLPARFIAVSALVKAAFLSLEEAVDYMRYSISTDSASKWFGVQDSGAVGTDAARSGGVGHNESSQMRCYVPAGTLTWKWKASSEQGHDFLRCQIWTTDTPPVLVVDRSISGSTGWISESADLPSGNYYSVTWSYTKDASGASGSDCGWVDSISHSASGLEGYYVAAPAAVDVVATTGQIIPSRTVTVFTVDRGGNLVAALRQFSADGHSTEPFQGSWLSLTVPPESGNFNGGEPDKVVLSFNTSGLSAGIYRAALVVYDPVRYTTASMRSVEVPVTLSIGSSGAQVLPQSAAAGYGNVWQFGAYDAAVSTEFFGQNQYGAPSISAGFGSTETGDTNSLQSAAIKDGEQSHFGGLFTGPSTLGWQWRVSSEPNNDYLEVLLDGEPVIDATGNPMRISGETSWQSCSLALTSGSHHVLWRYVKDGSVSAGTDAAWIDNISLEADSAGTAPRVALYKGTELLPVNRLANGGAATSYPATAVDSAVQWQIFTLQNEGSAALQISGISIPATGNFQDFQLDTSGTQLQLAPGASTSFAVAFAPTAMGARGATVQISSDDATDGTFVAGVAGSGVAVAATFGTAADVPLTRSGYSAAGKALSFTLNYAPDPGTDLIVVNNTGLPFITGVYSNLAQGQLVAATFGGQTYNFVADYYGGSGNDLVLHWAGSRVFAWGRNDYGEVGDSSTTQRNAPVSVLTTGALAGKTVTSVTAGQFHSVALCSDGTLAAWGRNIEGQLGDNTQTSSSVPVAVNAAPGSALNGKRVVAVTAGEYQTLALCSDGTVVGWGWNDQGELGDGTTTNRKLPVAVNTGASSALNGKTVVGISAGYQHTLAVCSDGTVAAWGYNNHGQLGDNTQTRRLLPILVNTTPGASALAGATVVAVSGGVDHSLALRSDGLVVAWGGNNFGGGQLGDNSTTDRLLPVLVNTASGVSALYNKTVVAIAGGGYHSIALCSDGTLTAWGNNNEGCLGDNTTTTRTVPVAVNTAAGLSALNGKTIARIAAGHSHTLVSCTDGTVLSWGRNDFGMLGDATTTARSVPVAVSRANLVAAERFATTSSRSQAWHTLGLVAGAPPIISTTAPSSVTTVAATLNGTFNPQGISTSLYFDLSTDGATFTPYSAAPATSSSPAAADFSLPLQGLTPGGTYYYRLRAESATGSVIGATLSFATLGQRQGWRQLYFGTTSNIGDAADAADGDRDGMVNLLEYATGRNPTVSDPLTTGISRSGGNLEFTYARNKAAVAEGLAFQVEWSQSLNGGWSTAGVTESVFSDDGTTQQVKASFSVGSQQSCFVRLRVSSPP